MPPTVILQRSLVHITEKCNCVPSTSVVLLTSLEATREDVMERVKEEWWSDVWVAGDNLSDTIRCRVAISEMVARQQHPS